MTPKAIQPLLFIPGGIPSKYTRYQNRFWFGTSPGQPYQMYLPYQLRHPFNDSNLLQSHVHVPTSWEDIVEYSAAMRGANENDGRTKLRICKYFSTETRKGTENPDC